MTMFRKTAILFVVGVALVGCESKPHFTVTGQIAEGKGETLYLDSIDDETMVAVDSVVLGRSGEFTFERGRNRYPELYQLRLKERTIVFSVDSTETIKINSRAEAFAEESSVMGNETAERIAQVQIAGMALRHTLEAIDYANLSPETYRAEVDSVTEMYKKMVRPIIYKSPLSPAAYYAFFQRFDGYTAFDPFDTEDSKALLAIATSHQTFYPESPRTQKLLALASEVLLARKRPILASIAEKVTVINHFDIELPDTQGKQRTLNELEGKAVLLIFFASGTRAAENYNEKLTDIYRLYAPRGLEIYQIYLNPEKGGYPNPPLPSVPWIAVYDKRSAQSPYLSLYNVQEIPTAFVLNGAGEIRQRITNPNQLNSAIEEALK